MALKGKSGLHQGGNTVRKKGISKKKVSPLKDQDFLEKIF